MLSDNGAPTTMNDYLLAMRIINPNVLAVFSPDEAHYRQHLVEPFVDGITIATVDYKTDAHPATTTAILLNIRSECLSKRATAVALANSVVLTPPFPPTMPAAGTSDTTTVPKTLKAGVWNTQIRKYEQIQLNGEDRSFPAEVLLGAESVLARVLHEHLTSKQYTPLKLGELLQSRAYTSSGQVNNMAQRPKKQKFAIDSENMLSTVCEEPWTPATHTAVTDGLTAAKWAYIFCELGTEGAVTRWIDHFEKITRQQNRTAYQVNALWMHAAWKVAIAMRAGKAFDLATADLLKDTAWWQEQYLMFNTTPNTRNQYEKGGSSGKGWQRQNREYSPEKSTRSSQWQGKPAKTVWPKPIKEKEDKTNQWASEEIEACKKYNIGTCNKDSETCSYAHKCSACGKFGHSAVGCWWKDTEKEDKGNKGNKGGKAKGKSKGSKGKAKRGHQSQDE